MKNKVWFITGASKGLGLSLVKKLLEKGYCVAATSRNVKELQREVGGRPDQFLALSVDLTNESSVKEAIDETVRHFGSVDVIVNNAGFGIVGSLEELSDEESRENFNINVFGSLNVIRKAMPYLRRQGSGHIFNIASIAGFNGAFPGFGIYTASKFAVHGFSESLSAEVKPFGVRVTIVSPGYFRTKFLEAGVLGVPKNEMAEYKKVREIQIVHQKDINGKQQGDPDKAADVMIGIASQPESPLHLFLGQDAYDLANSKIASIEKDMKDVEALATATGFSN